MGSSPTTGTNSIKCLYLQADEDFRKFLKSFRVTSRRNLFVRVNYAKPASPPVLDFKNKTIPPGALAERGNNIMKITKGMKLTAEQKAQRKASRERNRQAWRERHEQRRIEDEKRRIEQDARIDESMAGIKHKIDILEGRSETVLAVVIDMIRAPEIHRALEFFQKEFYEPAKPPLAQVAEMLLKLALTRPDQLIAWKHAHVKYRRDEGFTDMPEADHKILLSRIAGRKEYRTCAKA